MTASYDCVDRIVLNAYLPAGANPGGFRVWWRRWHDDGDDSLDDTHLMRLAGGFARRVRGWVRANDAGNRLRGRERKHRIAGGLSARAQCRCRRVLDLDLDLDLGRWAPATVWK